MKYKDLRGIGKVLLDVDKVNKLQDNLQALASKYKLDFVEIARIIKERNNFLNLPAEIFNFEISPLENVVMYLASEFNLKQNEIAKILQRDDSTIWTTFNNAVKKISQRNYGKILLKINKQIMIPVSIFAKRKLSILESLCIYLKDELKFSNADISHIVGRDQRTIWTVISRGRKKL